MEIELYVLEWSTIVNSSRPKECNALQKIAIYGRRKKKLFFFFIFKHKYANVMWQQVRLFQFLVVIYMRLSFSFIFIFFKQAKTQHHSHLLVSLKNFCSKRKVVTKCEHFVISTLLAKEYFPVGRSTMVICTVNYVNDFVYEMINIAEFASKHWCEGGNNIIFFSFVFYIKMSRFNQQQNSNYLNWLKIDFSMVVEWTSFSFSLFFGFFH